MRKVLVGMGCVAVGFGERRDKERGGEKFRSAALAYTVPTSIRVLDKRHQYELRTCNDYARD